MRISLVAFIISTFLFVVYAEEEKNVEQLELEAKEYMQTLNDDLNERTNKATEASWAYATNITDHNLEVKNKLSEENAKFYKVS